MCLIITAFAAVLTTLIWYYKLPDARYHLSTLSFMYWGATLMWLVDGFYCVAEGEAFLDLSLNDALLGIVIVLCGLVAYTILLLVKDPNRMVQYILSNQSKERKN